MEHETYLTHIGHDVERTLAVVRGGDVDAPVAACPGWGVRQLVEHLGDVHRWATEAIVSGGRPKGFGGEHPADATGLADWFAEGATALQQALTTTDPDADTWHPFPGEQKVWFWRRRQAHETAVHRWDAERATGLATPALDPALAADGVNEWAEALLPRVFFREKVAPPAGALGLRATDAGRAWVLHGGADGYRVSHHDAPCDASVEAPAATLLLALMGRADRAALATAGDAAVADGWLGLPGL